MRWFYTALAVIALSSARPQGRPQNLEGSATLQGSVRDPQGHPVSAATVHLQCKTGEPSLSVHADPAGNYRFPALHEGTYTLRAESSGYSVFVLGPFALGPKEVRKVELTLEPAFFDEPNFIVAGVTDTTSHGGHGSDTVLRSSEALARATASLGRESHGSPAPSADQLRQAVEREPTNAGLHHSLGDADEKLGNSLEAVREYQRAAELDATESNLFDWGAELLAHRAADQAIEVFSKGNHLYPHSVRMMLGLAAARYSRGDYDQAAQRFFEACDLNPSDPGPYLFLGKVQSAEILQSDGYLERMRRFARLQPDNALANYYYAAALWKRWSGPSDADTRAKVHSLLEKAVRLDSNLGAAYLQLGVSYADQKDFLNAISAYQKAIAVSPRLEEGHYRLAQAYRLAGQELKAQHEFERHAQLSKESAADQERERREIQQFVFALRGNSASPPH